MVPPQKSPDPFKSGYFDAIQVEKNPPIETHTHPKTMGGFNPIEKYHLGSCLIGGKHNPGPWKPPTRQQYREYHTHRIHVSMYGIFTYIRLNLMANVRKYTIHGSSGIQYPNLTHSHLLRRTNDSLGAGSREIDLDRSNIQLALINHLFVH